MEGINMTTSRPALRPYTKGWKAPWKHQWGPLGDGHSKLGRLRKNIERKLIKEYAPASDTQEDLVRDAAELLAVARMISQDIGVDPKANPRKVSVLRKTATGILREMRVSKGHQLDRQRDLARQLADVQRREEAHA
jgi:hypothetical protein